MINNIKNGWKTSAVGVILILASLAYLFLIDKVDKAIFFGILLSGIALLFTPDTFIDGIKKAVAFFAKKTEKIDIEDEINK